jgi:hypothetical protein
MVVKDDAIGERGMQTCGTVNPSNHVLIRLVSQVQQAVISWWRGGRGDLAAVKVAYC